MRIESLFRYPVKGLTAEALPHAAVLPGGALPWDRAFALAHGDAPFDPAAPAFLPKSNFMCLLRHARIAALQAGFEPDAPALSIHAPDGTGVTANPLDPAGREEIGVYLTAYLGAEARGAPRFHHVPGHVFGDQKLPVVSLLNLDTLAAYEADAGVERDPMRFRANVYFSGGAPWGEFEWVGRELRLGTARLRVTKRTVRCAAVEVNPRTAERDADPIRELRRLYGHADLGVHAAVVEAGQFAPGDRLEVL